jgi:Ser/Thr protein kinase RdoA (MazF antagonist)
MNQDIITIAGLFSDHTVITVLPFGNGNIHDTYLVTDTKRQFILQRLNTTVFTQPKLIFANQLQLQQLLDQQPESQTQIHIPQMIPAQNGCSHYKDQHNHYWRAQEFIKNGQEIQQLTLQQAESVGQLLGRFHFLCRQPSALNFHNTLQNLHITTSHIKQYHSIRKIPEDIPKTAFAFCQDCITSHQQEALHLDQQLHDPSIPRRLIHGDPKLANILFDTTTGEACSLIDLDTTGSGIIHHDLSDLIRSCCNSAKEDAPWHRVSFKLELAKKIISGYCTVTGSLLSQAETDLIGKTLWLIPFELGIRFLNDYLAGSVYFKTASPHHNLHRACNQFELAMQVQQHQPQLKEHIASCSSCLRGKNKID